MLGMSHRARGYTFALAAAALLSLTAIFIRHLTQTYHIPRWSWPFGETASL